MDCHFNSAYNQNIVKHGAKWRMGIISIRKKNGDVIHYQGSDEDLRKKYPDPKDISVKDFRTGVGHSWIELPNGKVVDWAVNTLLDEPFDGRIIWDIKELNDKGIFYTYYKHEAKILDKTAKEYNLKDDANVQSLKEYYTCK